MINNRVQISLSEIGEYVNKDSEKGKEILSFVKKFSKISESDAKKLREKLENLGILKIRGEHISKIIEIMPENSTDLNKIFVDTGLEEDETNKILESVKEFK